MFQNSRPSGQTPAGGLIACPKACARWATFTHVPARSAKPAAGSRQVASRASGESNRSWMTRQRRSANAAEADSSIHGPG